MCGITGIWTADESAGRPEFAATVLRKIMNTPSMHCSLEGRVPLLDPEDIDVSLRIDPWAYMRNGGRKSRRGTGAFGREGLRACWESHGRLERDRKWVLWTLMALQCSRTCYREATVAA